MAKRKTAQPKTDEAAPSSGAGYTVLARRFRPQQFGSLIGQEAVAQALTNAIESGRVAHAYLFTGARGVGKTSTARILAKCLNCVRGPTASPCGECDNCVAISSGDDTDVIEIDGASNRRIDEIRELRQNVSYRPSKSRFKIYIIDEVHMLTNEAFNALLKTLEEPPPHVKFIFATTEANDIPLTIRSRCQRFDFGNISIDLILARLKEIVASEKMQADDEALESIARRAGGSMRDAQSLLDQLLAFCDKKLTVDKVHQLLGTAHEEDVLAIAGGVMTKDAKKVLDLLGGIVDKGQQLGELLDQLVEYWRDLMIVSSAGIQGQNLSVSSAHRVTLEKHSTMASLDSILAGMDVLVTAKKRMEHSSHARAILEMSLVRLCQLDDLVPIAQIAQWLAKDGNSAVVRSRPVSAPPVPLPAEKKKLVDDNGSIVSHAIISLTTDSVAQVWNQLLIESGFAIQSELRKAHMPAISGPNALVLPVERRYNAPGTLFTDPAAMSKVEQHFGHLVGQTVVIQVEWVDDAGEVSPSAGKSPAAVVGGQQRMQRAELSRMPLVKQAMEVLGAQIVRADEGFGAAAKSTAGQTEEAQEGE